MNKMIICMLNRRKEEFQIQKHAYILLSSVLIFSLLLSLLKRDNDLVPTLRNIHIVLWQSIFAPNILIKKNYGWNLSTEENYRANPKQEESQFHGKYAAIRSSLDYKYHSNYTRIRQLFQDSIIDNYFLNYSETQSKNTVSEKMQKQRWIIFTAGPMGSGKSWTIRHLASRGIFPLEDFVRVDPDDIRRKIPEFPIYNKFDPRNAGVFTSKEAGLIAEILTLVALKRGYNVLQDGSLRDADWYQGFFQRLRLEYHTQRIKLGILHITASPEVVHERAKRRGRETGRWIPPKTLELSIQQVPQSVRILRPLVDFYAQIENSPGKMRLMGGMTWENFQQVWVRSSDDIVNGDYGQTCDETNDFFCESAK